MIKERRDKSPPFWFIIRNIGRTYEDGEFSQIQYIQDTFGR